MNPAHALSQEQAWKLVFVARLAEVLGAELLLAVIDPSLHEVDVLYDLDKMRPTTAHVSLPVWQQVVVQLHDG
jgi:hypothetical protein